MFVDDMKHSKIELSVLLSLCINLYIIILPTNFIQGWHMAVCKHIALGLHRGCRLNSIIVCYT